MASYDMADVAICIACGIFMLMVVYGVVRKARSLGLCSHMRSILATVLAAINPCGPRDLDEANSVVQVRAQQLRVEHFQWAVLLVSILLIPAVALILFNVATGNERSFSTVQTVVFMVIAISTAFILIFPDVVSSRSKDIVYVFLTIGVCIFASPLACKPSDMALIQILSIDIPLVLMNMARRKLSLNLLLNTMFAISSCSTILVYGTAVVSQPLAACCIQVLWLTIFPVCSHCVDLSISRMIRQGVEFQAAKEALSAASAMLRSSYDVVVELSGEGAILTSTTALDSFLLRGQGRRIQNPMFVDLISYEADRKLFLGKLFAPRHDDMGLAEATHVRMRDGNDNIVRVELLWFRFWHMDGQPRYMLGLREFSDVISAKNNQHQDNYRCSNSEVDNDIGSAATTSDISSADDDQLGELGELPAIVGVDTHCAGLHLREVSLGFNLRVGRLPLGTCLAELIHRRGEFIVWLEDATNAALNDETVPPCSNVTLLLRTGRVMAQCRLLVRPQDPDEVEQESAFDPEHVRLLFFDIKQYGHRRVSHRTGALEQIQRQATPVNTVSL